MTETEKIQQLTKVGKGVATAIVCPPPISPEDMRNLQEVAVSYRARMAALEAERATIPQSSTAELVVESLERVQVRKCVDCGEQFEAVGLTAYCDPCGIRVDAESALPPVKNLDSSWPKLHAGKLRELYGPALKMAEKLSGRLFGNRVCVLAGDRGRGKTQIATFIAYSRICKGHDSGIYCRAWDMVRLCSGYDKDAVQALQAFQRVPFLCIDEAHRIDPKQIHILESVIDARYANRRPLMVIGNWLSEEGMLNGENVSGQHLHGLGPTIMDRINEHTANRTGGVVWCRWESYRGNVNSQAISGDERG